MKKFLISFLTMFLFVCFSTLAFSEEHNKKHEKNSNPTSTVQGTATATANVTANSDSRSSVPDVIPPSLTTSNETCMGSSSVSGSGAFVGVGLGTTWKDEECVRRLNARQIFSMGYREAAKEVMCGNAEVNAAFKAVGHPCKLSPSSTTMTAGGAQGVKREEGILGIGK